MLFFVKKAKLPACGVSVGFVFCSMDAIGLEEQANRLAGFVEGVQMRFCCKMRFKASCKRDINAFEWFSGCL